MIPWDIILGGLTGLIGNAFTTWFKYKNAKMEYTHREKMVSLETQAMIQESQMQIEVTKSRIEGEIELADVEAFKTSQIVGSEKLFHEKWIDMIMQNSQRKWTGWIYTLCGVIIAAMFAFVDLWNTIMRPALTTYLVGMSTFITFLAWDILNKAGIETLTSAEALVLFKQVTTTMIYLTVSCVTWWYGDRTMSKYLQRIGIEKKDDNVITTRPPTGDQKRGGGDVDIIL